MVATIPTVLAEIATKSLLKNPDLFGVVEEVELDVTEELDLETDVIELEVVVLVLL